MSFGDRCGESILPPQPRCRQGGARLYTRHTLAQPRRIRDQSCRGRSSRRKWNRELNYRLIKELWAFQGNRIAVRYAYEYHDDSGQWFRAYGNENWEFADDGLMRARHASINEHPITEAERKFRWPLGRRPDDYPGLGDFGF
ncbi:Protein of unknown function [Rhizobium mongolense subsp. loessense]|uniref:DUF1348 family protein n=1 Tax=Rhizobium mongolense subsp. loessense TaxID=158890 RepID=A0A1G4U604_9HYPH|nr:Protein of unknown function [Rhizobium mongolense subsp. loessense]